MCVQHVDAGAGMCEGVCAWYRYTACRWLPVCIAPPTLPFTLTSPCPQFAKIHPSIPPLLPHNRAQPHPALPAPAATTTKTTAPAVGTAATGRRRAPPMRSCRAHPACRCSATIHHHPPHTHTHGSCCAAPATAGTARGPCGPCAPGLRRVAGVCEPLALRAGRARAAQVPRAAAAAALGASCTRAARRAVVQACSRRPTPTY